MAVRPARDAARGDLGGRVQQRRSDSMTLQLHIKRSLKQSVNTVNEFAAAVKLALCGDAPGLAIILMHSVYPCAKAIESDRFDPHHPMLLDDFEKFVAELHANGFTFVSDREVSERLAPDGKYVWLTLDDGYANNLAILPILQKYNAQATIFVSAGNVLQGRSFWWDVLWRESRARNVPPADIRSRGSALKRLPYHEIERQLLECFGRAAFEPAGEYDRPLTPDELKALAQSPSISIGNHTVDHAILTQLSHEDGMRQIERCQDLIADMIGFRPISIAYPNGSYTEAIAKDSGQHGLTVGVTTERRRRVPGLPLTRPMTLPRISMRSDQNLSAQIRMLRASLKLSNGLFRTNRLEAGRLVS